MLEMEPGGRGGGGKEQQARAARPQQMESSLERRDSQVWRGEVTASHGGWPQSPAKRQRKLRTSSRKKDWPGPGEPLTGD